MLPGLKDICLKAFPLPLNTDVLSVLETQFFSVRKSTVVLNSLKHSFPMQRLPLKLKLIPFKVWSIGSPSRLGRNSFGNRALIPSILFKSSAYFPSLLVEGKWSLMTSVMLIKKFKLLSTRLRRVRALVTFIVSPVNISSSSFTETFVCETISENFWREILPCGITSLPLTMTYSRSGISEIMLERKFLTSPLLTILFCIPPLTDNSIATRTGSSSLGRM